MKTSTPEVLFAALLLTHIVLNTISRVIQRRTGNRDNIFPESGSFIEINLGNYTCIQILFGIQHLVLVGFGLLTIWMNWGSRSSFMYAGLLSSGVVLVFIIFRRIEFNTEKPKPGFCSKENRQTWVGFYSITLIGILVFGYMGGWNLPLLVTFFLAALLCGINQTFNRVNPRDLKVEEVPAVEANAQS